MAHVSIDEQYLKTWTGRQEQQRDFLAQAPLDALAATLDREDGGYPAGVTVPPLWHWLYFLPAARQSLIDTDGHPQRGGFLPPVSLPRRMWAGGRLQFHGDLRVGVEVERLSTILDVSHKSGRSGELVFVKLRHELVQAGEVRITEEQDIVYRDPPRPGDPQPAPQAAPATARWSRTVRPDPVLLFRYSALTFNGHRIHYDRPYAQQEEGYPGLVVHGPLLATLLMNLLRDECPRARVAGFSFRAVRPVFDTTAFQVCAEPEADGRGVRLWVQDGEGFLCMDARAELA